MKKLLFIGLFLCCAVSSYGQVNVDSLEQKLLQDIPDSVRVNTLLELSNTLIDSNIDTVIAIANEGIALSDKIGYIRGKWKFLNVLGNCAQRKGNLDSAMQYYDEVEKIALELEDDKGMAIVLSNKGIIYINKAEYLKAIEIILEAIDYEIIVGDQKGMAQGYLNVGVVHYYMQDMENTLIYFKKSVALSEEEGDRNVLKKGYINIGAIHQYLEEYDQALEFYQRGLDIAIELNDEPDINLTRHNMAQIYTEKGEFDKVEKWLVESLAFQKRIGNQKGIAVDFTNLGNLYKEKGRFKKAEEFFLKSIEISTNGGYLKELENSYGELSDMYAEDNQFEAAFNWANDYISLKDSLLNEENSKTFAELRTKYETAEKEKALAEEKIKSESLAKDVAEVELSTANRNKWIVVLISFIIGIVLLFMILRQRNKRRVQSEKDAAIIEERDKGTQAVFEAQEEERKRISTDLHDGVGQQLSGLKMAFQKLGGELSNQLPEKAQEVEKLSQVLSESADEVRSISHQMMPKALTELGLIEALEDMLSKSLGVSDIGYQFEHFGIPDRLEERIEINLYRVAQELVNNIIKHSKATQISVQLFKNSDKVILVIEDNGIGVKGDQTDGHGLLNMKSRVNALNGEMNLEPSPNSGTLATIRVPII